MNDFVYLLKCNEFYKIGVARAVEVRVSSLQTGNPYKIETIGKYKCRFEKDAEKALHLMYDHDGVRGEWFKLWYSDPKTIDDLYRFNTENSHLPWQYAYDAMSETHKDLVWYVAENLRCGKSYNMYEITEDEEKKYIKLAMSLIRQFAETPPPEADTVVG